MGIRDDKIKEALARAAALGLHPLSDPLGDNHHTDAPLTDQDLATGDALAYFLGTLFADVDGDPSYWHTKRTSIDEWSRVARALRIHGLAITDLAVVFAPQTRATINEGAVKKTLNHPQTVAWCRNKGSRE